MRGIVGYFKKSTAGLHDLKECQEQLGIAIAKLIQNVVTRWRSGYDMADSFLLNKEALIQFDVKHINPGEAYKDNKLTLGGGA